MLDVDVTDGLVATNKVACLVMYEEQAYSMAANQQAVQRYSSIEIESRTRLFLSLEDVQSPLDSGSTSLRRLVVLKHRRRPIGTLHRVRGRRQKPRVLKIRLALVFVFLLASW